MAAVSSYFLFVHLFVFTSSEFGVETNMSGTFQHANSLNFFNLLVLKKKEAKKERKIRSTVMCQIIFFDWISVVW